MGSPAEIVKVGERHRVKVQSIGQKGDGIAKIQKLVVIVVGQVEVDKEYDVEITRLADKVAFAEVVDGE